MNAQTVIGERRGEVFHVGLGLRREWGRRKPGLQGGAVLADAQGRPSRWFAGVWRGAFGSAPPPVIVTPDGRPTLDFLRAWP